MRGKGSRTLLGTLFVAAGANHFVMPRAYEAIVPPSLRARAQLVVQVSGVAELAGGLGVLIPSTRRLACCWRSSRPTCTWRASTSASAASRAGRCSPACRCSR